MNDHPMTIEQEIAVSAYPAPVPGEDIAAYARRVAQVAAHQGVAWALTHTTPTVIRHPEDIAAIHGQAALIQKIDDLITAHADEPNARPESTIGAIARALHPLPEKADG